MCQSEVAKKIEVEKDEREDRDVFEKEDHLANAVNIRVNSSRLKMGHMRFFI